MRRYFIIVFLFTLFCSFPNDSSSDTDILSDDDYLNLDISEITERAKKNDQKDQSTTKKKRIGKKEIEDAVVFDLSVTGRNSTEFRILRNSAINSNNIFGITTFVNKTFAEVQAKISFGKIFQIYVDDSFRFVYESNDIAHIKSEGHKNNYNKFLDNIVKEIYLLWNIPIKYPIKIVFGRTFYNPETSVAFLTSNNLNYVQKSVSSFLDYDDCGVNMLKFSVYFPMVSLDLIYSPGIYEENEITKMFNIQKEHKFASKVDFNLKKVNFNVNGYVDTNLKWSAATSISVNINDEIILYSDLALKGKEKKLKIEKSDEILYGNMNKYEVKEIEKIVDFSGVLFGINYTPKSILTIYGELYFNTNGFFPDEQKEFFTNYYKIKNNYENPQYPEFAPNSEEIKTNFKYYYMGKLGEAALKYDAFNLGAFYYYTQIGKDNIAGVGLDLSLSAFISLFDGSALLSPKVKYTFLKYFSVAIDSSLFLGTEKSLIGEIPFIASFKIILEAKL